jgi:hypothetical protein
MEPFAEEENIKQKEFTRQRKSGRELLYLENRM